VIRLGKVHAAALTVNQAIGDRPYDLWLLLPLATSTQPLANRLSAFRRLVAFADVVEGHLLGTEHFYDFGM